MRLTVWLFTREVFTVSLGAEPVESAEEADEDDRSRDLSGGTTGSMEMGVGFVPHWLGETGMEGGDPDG